jgi:TonB family protein
LWLIVDENGLPRDIKVRRALGMGLDDEAIKAVKQWRFQPASKDGRPVAVMINVEVNFRLYDTLHPPDRVDQSSHLAGVNTPKYPLIVHVGSQSYSGPGNAQRSNYKVTLTDSGRDLQGTISCAVASSQCLHLDDGMYPARWEENMQSMEILGLSNKDGTWATTEYAVSIEEIRN